MSYYVEATLKDNSTVYVSDLPMGAGEKSELRFSDVSLAKKNYRSYDLTRYALFEAILNRIELCHVFESIYIKDTNGQIIETIDVERINYVVEVVKSYISSMQYDFFDNVLSKRIRALLYTLYLSNRSVKQIVKYTNPLRNDYVHHFEGRNDARIGSDVDLTKEKEHWVVCFFDREVFDVDNELIFKLTYGDFIEVIPLGVD